MNEPCPDYIKLVVLAERFVKFLEVNQSLESLRNLSRISEYAQLKAHLDKCKSDSDESKLLTKSFERFKTQDWK